MSEGGAKERGSERGRKRAEMPMSAYRQRHCKLPALYSRASAVSLLLSAVLSPRYLHAGRPPSSPAFEANLLSRCNHHHAFSVHHRAGSRCNHHLGAITVARCFCITDAMPLSWHGAGCRCDAAMVLWCYDAMMLMPLWCYGADGAMVLWCYDAMMAVVSDAMPTPKARGA